MSEPLFVDINTLATRRGDDLVQQGKRLFGGFKQGAEAVGQALFPKQPDRYVGVNDPTNKRTVAVKVPEIDPTGMVGLTSKVGTQVAKKTAEPVFKGFKDISTKLLEKLKSRSTVSKQFVSDLTNQPDLKQAEKDLIRRILGDEPDNINVSDFANRVKSELLPLERRGGAQVDDMQEAYRYENITLPGELRGPVANYSEHVYDSPIKTSAGQVHFGGNDSGNYFAHTRIEDLPIDPYESIDTVGGKGKVRRVIEIQSDLFQKGRLEEEIVYKDFDEAFREAKSRGGLEYANKVGWERAEKEANELATQWMKEQEQIKKLEPYRNTWHERVIREEVKKAAQDGKTKLQFPTGETAMKIEGLGETQRFYIGEAGTPPGGWEVLDNESMKVGQEITDNNTRWIITDVLGDGKFKAISKNNFERALEEAGDTSLSVEEALKSRSSIGINNYTETFDISGKVDTNNPIYKFYEKTVQKYLTNKYGGKVIKDPQGVKWVEIDVKPEAAGLPVEAFGALAPLTLMSQDEKQRRLKSTPVDRESLFITK